MEVNSKNGFTFNETANFCMNYKIRNTVPVSIIELLFVVITDNLVFVVTTNDNSDEKHFTVVTGAMDIIVAYYYLTAHLLHNF